MLALFMLRSGRRLHGKTFDRDAHDNLTVGLARHASRNLHRIPAAILRLRRAPHRSAAFFERYDVVLTPTLAHATPRVGHLDPTQDYETVVDRLQDWVAFTPLQNVSGDPAISLPLATTSGGCRWAMSSPRERAARRCSWSWPTSSRRPSPSRGLA